MTSSIIRAPPPRRSESPPESLRAVVLSVDKPRSIRVEFIPAVATVVASVERGDMEAAEHEIERAVPQPNPEIAPLVVNNLTISDENEAARATDDRDRNLTESGSAG